MEQERLYYNALALYAGGNYYALRDLKTTYATWEIAYGALGAAHASLPDPEEAWAMLARHGITCILQTDNRFPKALKEISQPPFALYIKGNPTFEIAHFTIVGTRKATQEGKKLAEEFGTALSAAGFVVVSGLAFGIDAAAHEGVIKRAGATLAVLGNGLDIFYPRSNQWLGEKILEAGGAIISEYPLGERPWGYRFLERNRIVSGLSKGLLVIEAPERSGSLATARYALEQNRDVFVTPGPLGHPNFKGSHALIRQGAELVTCPEDILESYGLATVHTPEYHNEEFSREEMLILKALRESLYPLGVDKVIAMTKLESHVASRTLSFLLLKNVIKETDAGYIIV